MTRLRLIYLASIVPLTEHEAHQQARRDAARMNYTNRASDLICRLRLPARVYEAGFAAALVED